MKILWIALFAGLLSYSSALSCPPSRMGEVVVFEIKKGEEDVGHYSLEVGEFLRSWRNPDFKPVPARFTAKAGRFELLDKIFGRIGYIKIPNYPPGSGGHTCLKTFTPKRKSGCKEEEAFDY